MPIYDAATQAAMSRIMAHVTGGTPTITAGAAEIIRASIMAVTPRESGQLASSIAVTMVSGTYAMIGPKTIYARQRELGGDLPEFKQGALMTFYWPKISGWMRTYHVHQVGAHYTLRGLEAARTEVEGYIADHWRKLMKG